MTNQERETKLISLGYTQQEADFLCRAALHSGYFLRRQFLAFTEADRGKRDGAFTDKLIKNGHAKVAFLRHNRALYHLRSKPLYYALGEIDNRNRRDHFVFTIKARLMALDFVLLHQHVSFLATETEKVRFFTEELGITKDHLPFRRYRSKNGAGFTDRFFIEKFPIYISGAQQAVHFTYVDEGLHSTSGFERFLNEYRPLLSRLASAQLVYVACFPDLFASAEGVFRTRIAERNVRAVDPLITRFLDFCRARAAYEGRDLAAFDQHKLIQFREDRVAFTGLKYDQLFTLWCQQGDIGVLKQLAPECAGKVSEQVAFSTFRLPFNYALFGSLADGDWRGSDHFSR